MTTIDFTPDPTNVFPPGGGTPGNIPKFDSTGDALEDSSITEEPGIIRFSKRANFPPGSIELGVDGVTLASAARTVDFTDAYGATAIPIGTIYDATGNLAPFQYDFGVSTDTAIADVFDTTLADPQEMQFPANAADAITRAFSIRPATSGTLRIEGFAGTATTDPVIIDTTITIDPGDIGTIKQITLDNRILIQTGDSVRAKFSGVQLNGGLQTSGDFNGQTVPFLNADFADLTRRNIVVQGDPLNQDPLGTAAGSINYDPVKGTMNVRNIFTGSSIQVGQENVVFVVNNSGATITDGKIVNISGYDAANDAMEIELAIADTVENTEVLGVTTTTMINGSVGLVTVFGRVNDLDTTSFAAGDIVFLSDTVAGQLTTTKPSIPIQMGHIGKIDASTGFLQVEIKEMEKSIFGGFSHLADQTFTANVSKAVAFDKNEEFSGIVHSETVDNDEFTFDSGGVYQATIEPQYTRTTGGGTDVLNMFLSRDIGAGFVNVVDTNVKLAVNTAGVTTVSPLTITFRVVATDKIRFMAQAESADLVLDFFAASGTAPNDIPATPSVIMNIMRIGD